MSVSYSPDGRHLASASSDKTVRIWTAEGELLCSLQGHSDRVNSVSYSPDGRHLASASSDGTVRIWTAEGELLHSLKGHSHSVNSVSYSPDGRFMASASDDGTVRIWTAEGELERSLPCCIMSADEDGQWWSLEVDENRRITRLLGTELAWQRVWLSHEDGAASFDKFKGFEFVPSEHCLTHRE